MADKDKVKKVEEESAEETTKGKGDNVPKAVDEVLAKADADAGKVEVVEEAPEAEEAEKETPAAPPAPQAGRPNLVNQDGELFEAYILKRLLVPETTAADGLERVHEPFISMEIAEKFLPHYDLFSVGIAQSGQSGNDVLWQFVKPAKGKPKHKEIKHFFRSVGSPVNGAVAGFQANETISAYLQDGWELFHWETFGADQSGSFVMWVLLR